MGLKTGVPSLKLTAKAPENRPFAKGNEKVFQPFIFRGENVSLGEGNCHGDRKSRKGRIVGPFPNGRNLWLKNRGDPNHLHVLG